MNRSQTLEEFAEDMRRKGDIRQSDLADEILMLVDLETDVAEPYGNLCDDLNNYAPKGLEDRPEKQMEWVGDRSNLLKEIEDLLDADGRTGDTDDQVKALLEMAGNIRTALGLDDKATDEDIETAVQALVDAQPNGKFTYDL